MLSARTPKSDAYVHTALKAEPPQGDNVCVGVCILFHTYIRLSVCIGIRAHTPMHTLSG
jgi:hypothetical protein